MWDTRSCSAQLESAALGLVAELLRLSLVDLRVLGDGEEPGAIFLDLKVVGID